MTVVILATSFAAANDVASEARFKQLETKCRRRGAGVYNLTVTGPDQPVTAIRNLARDLDLRILEE